MKRILLIEDNRELAERIADILIMSGYIVSITHKGDNGKQSFFGYWPDFVISDICMSETDKREFLEIIRKDNVYTKLPTIVLTGKATGLGVVIFKKPYDADEFVCSVSQRTVPSSLHISTAVNTVRV